MLNHIIIIGRLTRDPELKYTSSGIPVAHFAVAVDRPRKNQDTGEKVTDFLDVVAWRQTAEFVNSYISKGRLVAVEGRLQIRSWEAQDGSKRKSAEIVAENIQGLDRPKPQETDHAEADVNAPPKHANEQSHGTADDEDYDPFGEE